MTEKPEKFDEVLQEKIYEILKKANAPLITSEIAEMLKLERRVVLRRLQRMAIEGKVKGRRVDVANGIWIWWL